jgi:hypothetical protein
MSDGRCPKCRGEMVLGFAPDATHGGIRVGLWHEGPPKKSFWLGTRTGPGEGIPIGVLRCTGCGYLEFFADPKFAAE